jgi:hypothetical protein
MVASGKMGREKYRGKEKRRVHAGRAAMKFVLKLFAVVYRARICIPFKEPRNRFQAWWAGKTILFDVPAQGAQQSYIGWRNGFLEIDSWGP